MDIFMLCRIKAALALTTLLPIVTFAATDKDCLNHLGGAFGDVECYNGLSNDLRARNQDLYVQVTATIPKDNKIGNCWSDTSSNRNMRRNSAS